jgi:3-phosphoshikimate 1-carboxyvinyltransferase
VDLIVEKSGPLRGEVSVPGDKSVAHRALLMGAVATGITRVSRFLHAEDTHHTAEALRALGIQVEVRKGDGPVEINGVGLDGFRAPSQPLYLGNSGTGMRLLTGLLAGQRFSCVLEGDASLSRRPMDRIARPLAMMGARITGTGERCLPPLRVEGKRPLNAIQYELPVASAQVKSAVLLASLYADGETEVIEPLATRDHTERMLRLFGADVQVRGASVVVCGGQKLAAQDLSVPGDISSAAFFLVAASIVPGSEILLPGVGVNPRRTGVLDALREMGANISLHNEREESGEPVADIAAAHAPLKGCKVGEELAVRAIDEIPVLCVAAAFARGETVIKGAAELRVKESDRIGGMAAALRAMGAEVEELPDGLIVRGGKELRGSKCDSGADHRVAMAMAVAGLAAEGTTVIKGAEWVATSYPDFAEDLTRLGARAARI